MQIGQAQVTVPQNIIDSWQEIVNILAKVTQVPAALIMRLLPEETLLSHAQTSPCRCHASRKQ